MDGWSRSRNITLLLGLFAVGVLAGGGIGWVRHASADPETKAPEVLPATSSPLTPVTPPSGQASPDPTLITDPTLIASPTPQSVSPTPTKKDLENQAVRDLKNIAADDRTRIHLHGQWVAQLSSKYIGVKDPLQTTSAGSHTFKARDILEEHQRLRAQFGESDQVVLLRGQDWGAGLTHKGDGATFWYTFVIGDFADKADVSRFCQEAYPQYSGEHREDFCLPRRLQPRR